MTAPYWMKIESLCNNPSAEKNTREQSQQTTWSAIDKHRYQVSDIRYIVGYNIRAETRRED